MPVLYFQGYLYRPVWKPCCGKAGNPDRLQQTGGEGGDAHLAEETLQISGK